MDQKKYILGRLPNMAFLCGANKKDSMRSKFLDYVEYQYNHIFVSGKATKNIFSDERIIIAEKVQHLWETCLTETNSGYNNLLDFEMDIARLASVIPIFLEGCGAMIEAGAFLCEPSLKKKLLIILNEKHFNKDSFIQRAIIKDPCLSEGRIIYYDIEKTNHNEKIFQEIFSFRDKDYRIETQENNPTSLYFSLLEILCTWKTEEQIIEELNKNNELKRYTEKLGNHLKILKSLGLIIEEPDFNKIKFLSLIRADCSLSAISPSASRNEFHNRDIFKQVADADKTMSNLVLLKYMKIFADEDYFSYSYSKKYPSECYKKPQPQLDVLQKVLKTRILDNKDIFPIHESAMAYVKGSNIRKNVEKHYKNQFILKLDFKSFFNSIKRKDFFAYLKNINLKCQKLNTYIEFICDIAFKDDSITNEDFSLPIGASTSPIISNILLYSFDEKISEYSHSLGITYTRYADDLAFSHDQPNKLSIMESEVQKVIKEIPYPSDLQINNKKTVHMSKKGQRKITGLYLTPEGKISIGRNKKNYIKKLLRNYEEGENKKKFHIQGHLCFIKNIEKELWDRLHNKYKDKEQYRELFHDIN